MRISARAILLFSVMGSVSSARRAPGAELVLVKEGKANAAIVYPARLGPPAADATEEPRNQHERARRVQATSHSAAERLRAYLKDITGAELPLAPDTQPPAGNLILVGDTAQTRRMGIHADKLSGDSFAMRVKGFIEDPLDPLVFKEDTRWAPRWEARATVDPDRKRWIAEIAIPFGEIGGAPAKAAKWRMNFCRERWIGEPRGPWDPKWSPTFREFGLPARFGTATFR